MCAQTHGRRISTRMLVVNVPTNHTNPSGQAYVKWHGKLPPPLHRLYCEYAWKSFWISNTHWNNPDAKLLTMESETVLHPYQVKIIDDLWDEFKTTGDSHDERGYNLHKIPARLSTDWNQSALRDRINVTDDHMDNDAYNAFNSALAIASASASPSAASSSTRTAAPKPAGQPERTA